MKFNSTWWILSTMGLGVIVAANVGGCGTENPIGAGGAGGSESSSTSSTSSSTGMPVDKGDWLALPCENDAECGKADAICVKPDAKDPAFGGGAQNGYCSKACKVSADCPGMVKQCYLGPTGKAAEGRCVLPCEVGPALMEFNPFGSLDGSKCHGREDVRCQSRTGGDICVPTCSNDTECGANRVCQLNPGVCVEMAAPGGALGDECDPNSMASQCSTGLCVTGLGAKGFCSGFCVFGGDPNQGECGGTDKGLCMIPPSVPGCPAESICTQPGDYAFCAPSCAQHDDCPAPGLWCRTIAGAPFCFFTAECPNGQMDCKDLMGYTCTETKFGPYCLEAKYPLGDTAPVMDGGMDGGGGMGMGGMGGMGGSAMDAGASDSGADSGDGG